MSGQVKLSMVSDPNIMKFPLEKAYLAIPGLVLSTLAVSTRASWAQSFIKLITKAEYPGNFAGKM